MKEQNERLSVPNSFIQKLRLTLNQTKPLFYIFTSFKNLPLEQPNSIFKFHVVFLVDALFWD